MSLADYQPLSREVPLQGGTLRVRGLGLDDVAVLLNEHLPDIDNLLNLYDDNVDPTSKVVSSAQFALVLARRSPALVAQAIALAADEPDEVDKARRIGLAAQVQCLKIILTLTFEEAGGFRKFVESLAMILSSMAPAAPNQVSHT